MTTSKIPYRACVYKHGGHQFHKVPTIEWDELIKVIDSHEVTMPMCFFPPRLYMDVFYALVCHKHSIPVVTSSVYNLAMTAYTITQVSVDAVVTTSEVIPYLLQYMHKHHIDINIKLFIYVGNLTENDHRTIISMAPQAHIVSISNPFDKS